MAIIKKYLFDEKLESYGVFIEDTVPNSDYFKITELPDVLTGGKNAFLIQGSPELDSDSIVKVQIRDSEGNTIYHEPGEGIPEYYEGTSKVVSVYIYPDTSFGPCTITILGELKEYKDSNGITIPIPENWKGVYNVRWQKQINVNPLLNNTTKIRFYRRPKISITESVLPVYSIAFNRQTISGSISGVAVNPEEGSDFRTFKGDTLYELRITGSLFSASMEGETISITGLNKPYETTIKEVINSNKVLATIPYYETSSNDSTSYQNILSFTSKPFTLVHNVSSTLSNSSVSSSFAKIKISDLETFSGDVNRVKIYASRVADIGSYALLEDIRLESNELFLEDLFSGSVGVRTGVFSNQTIVDSFWKYIDYGSTTTYSKNIDNNLLVSSVKLEDAGTQNLTEFPQRLFYNTSLLDFTKNTEYQIDFTPLLSSSAYSYNKISVYASGSAFANSSDSLPIGKLVGEIDTNDAFTKFDKQQFNFKPESDGTGNIVFAIQQGNWHLSNISLRSSQETNFSPNELTLNVNIPTKVNYDTYDFKFEFYDINNNYVPVNVNKEYTFVGGSDSFATKALILSSDLNLFSFSGSSPMVPVGASSTQFNVEKIGLTGSITYYSSAFDINGDYINPSSYIGGQYPGLLTNVTETTSTLTATNFTGSNNSINVSRILYTASCEGVQDTLNIYRFDQGAQGVDGANAVQYVIVPQNGTIIKNSSGSLELQLSKIDGTSVIELSAGNIKLVTGSSNTIINVGDGITNGGNGASYNPIIDSTKISGSLLIKAYDFDTNTILDSITLADVSDGLSAGAINSSNGLTFVRETNNGNFINPASTKLTASFFLPTGQEISESVLITPNYTAGNDTFTYTMLQDNPNIGLVVKAADGTTLSAGSPTNTRTISTTFTYSNVRVSETLNILVDGVNGTGANASVVNLVSPYYLVSYDTNGNLISPSAAFPVTASSQNFTTPYFKFTGDVDSPDSVYSVGSGNSDTASFTPPSTYFSIPKNIRVGVAEASQTEVAFDTISIAAVRVGSSGDNPQYYYIQPLSGSQIRNSQGTLELQAVWISGSVSRNLKSGSIVFTTGSVATSLLRTGSGIFSGSQTNTGPNSYLWNTTINSTGISGSKIIYLIDSGSNRVYDTITLLDTTDGVAGGSVVANSLITRRDPIANTYSPTSLPATASFFGTNGVEYTAKFTVVPVWESSVDKLYYTVQSSASAILVQADDGEGNQFTSGSFANRLTTKDINFKFTFTDPQTLDTSKINETFYIISDGADGEDAYTVVLTNDSHTLPTTNTGTVTYTNSGTSILAYRGTTELNGITTGVPTSGQFSASAITATNITPGTLTSTGNPIVVSDHSAMTSDIANISYTINLEGTQSFTKIQTFSKARQGGDGFSNVSYVIVPISGTILKNKSGTLELQIARLSGSRYDYISGGTIVLVTGSANTTIAAGNGVFAGTNGVSYNAIFDSTKISGSLIVRARDTSANITYDTITLADITDGVAAGGINSTNGLILVRNPNNNNTYTPSTTQLTASFYDVNGKQYTSSLLVTPNFTTTDQLRYTTGISDSNMILEVRDVLGNVMTNNTYANTIGLNVRYTFTDPVSKDIVDAIETVQIASDGAKGLIFFADASKTQFVFDPDDNNKPALLYDYTDIYLKRNFNSGSSTFRIISGSTMPPLTLVNTTFVGEFTQSVYRLYTGTTAENATSWSYNTPSTAIRTGTYVFTQANFSSSVDISSVLKGSGSKNLEVTSNANQFFYKMTDRSLSPTGQTITMLAKRNNLGNANAIITVTSGSGLPPLAVGSTTNGVTSYSVSGTNYAYLSGSTTYTFTAPDLNASTYTDTITITPVLLPSQINVIASNENATLPANGYGFVASASFAATSGSLSVKVGSDTISYASTLVSNSFSASISASFGVTGGNVVSPGIYSITRLDADSGSLLLKVTYADGIGSQSVFTKDITYTKAKNAIPTTIALLSSETQTVLSSSTIAAPSTFTVSVNEGASNYTYDAALSANNTFYISSITGGTNASAVVTPTTPTSDSGTTVALTISYRNSIGGTGTINKNHIVSVSKKGDIGTTGNTGADGKRVVTGMIHYQLSSGTAPSTPSATTYTFSSNTFTSLTSNWGVGAPIFSGSNSSKYWYSTYTAVETTSGGGTATPTFSTPSQAIGFTGLVTFTSTDKITDGTNVTNIASTSSVTNHIGGPNVTTINGGRISTGTITSTRYSLLGADTLTSGSFMGEGTIFNLDDSGSIRSKNFYIDNLGNAVLRGSVTITGGNAATTTALSSSLTTANNLAFSASVSASNAVTSGSAFASNAVTSGSNAAANAVTSGSAFASNAVTSGSNAAARAVTSGSNAADRAAASASLSGSVDPLTQQLTKIPTPAGSGLYLGSNFLGYYKNGAGWNTFMSSSGDFFLSGSGATYLTWQNGLLTIAGAINVTSGNAATSAALTSSLGLVATNSALSSSFTATNAALTSSFGIQSTSASVAGLTARALAYGKVLYRDATFIDTTNSTFIYNNAGGSAVTRTFATSQTDSPNSGTSGRDMEITYNSGVSPAPDPNYGGFYFATQTRANAIFVTKIIAKIPVGRSISFHSNAWGTVDQSQQWLTDVNGTGKYTEYICYVKCGSVGPFSTTNFFAIAGGANSTFTWYVSFATVYDLTDNDIRTMEGIIAASGSVNPASQKITKAATPGAAGGGSGLYLGNNNLGYYDGSNWRTYMDSSGNFYLGGTGGSLQWNAGTNALSISGKITVTDTTSNVATNSSLTSSLSTKYDASNPSGYQDATNVNNATKTSGYVGGWTINSTSIFSGTEDYSGYTTSGITLYGGGSIHAKEFYIDTSGNAFFKGNIAAGSITTGLGYTPPTPTQVTSSISQIQIGGRNLLLNSQPIVYNQIVGTAANGSTITVDTTRLWKGQPTLRVVGNGGTRWLSNPIIEPYTEYIVSMMVKADSTFVGSQTYPLHIQLPADNHTHEVLGDYDQTVTTDWKQIWLKFASNQTTNTTFQVYLYNIGTTPFNVAWVKLEKGNKQTDWTPAPEDIASGSIGNVDILGSGVVNYNPDFSISTVDGKPAGALGSFGSSNNSVISFLDSNKNSVKLSDAVDSEIGLTMPAIRLNKDAQYNITFRIKSNTTTSSGFYFRMQEIDAELPQGYTNISGYAGATGVYTTSVRDVYSGYGLTIVTGTATEDGPMTTSYVTYQVTYKPTSTAKWASPLFLKWGTVATSVELHIDRLTIQQDTSIKTQGSVGGWTIDGDSIFTGTKDTSGYSTTGITLYGGGSIHAPQFYIDTSGNAFFNGSITAGSITTGLGYTPPTTTDVNNAGKTAGSVGGWTINSSQIYAGTAGSDGVFNAGAGITLGGTGYISSKNFYIDSSGNAKFKGNITFGAGGSGINVAPVGMRYDPRDGAGLSSANYDNVSLNGLSTENAIDYRTDPFGNTSLVWQCYPAANTYPGDGDGGWNSNQFAIDNNKTYKFVVYVKRYQSVVLAGYGTTGITYWGVGGNSVRNLSDSTLNGNPYFVESNTGITEVNKWYLLVGYVYGNLYAPTSDNKGGVYDCTTGAKVAGTNAFKWDSSATTTNHRSYLYYNIYGDGATLWQEMWNPSVYEVDGTEPDLNKLLDKGKMVGNGSYSGGTFIDGKTVYAPNISGSTGDFTGKITATSGEIGGWIIDSDKLYSPPSGSNNVIKMKLEPNSINPQFTLTDGGGAPAVVIKTGQLLDVAVGAATSTVTWDTDNSGFTTGTTTNDVYETKYNTAEAFTISATGLYTGTVTLSTRNAFTPLASGYYRYDLGIIITDDPGIGNILHQSSIALVTSFSEIGVQKVFPSATKTVEVTFNSTGTYYILSYWERLATGDVPSATWNGVSHDFPTFTLSKATAYTELTDFGFQSIRSSDRYVKIQRVGSTDTMLKVGGDIEATGNITAYSSDMRLKTNINILQNPLEKLSKLSGFTYNWNDKANELVGYDTNESIVGMFAQDVQEVLPEAVRIAPFDNDGDGNSKSGENYLTVQYEKVVPLLVEAIKELKNEIEELKTQINKK